MRYLLTPVLFIVLLACKKEKTWEDWDNLATKKLEEIHKLSLNHQCADIPDLTLQAIPSFCTYSIIVHKRDIQKFNTLLNEYQKYSKKAYDAGKPIPYYDECTYNGAVKINCKDEKPYIVKLNEVSVEEIPEHMASIYQEIKSYYNGVTCSNSNDWRGTSVINGDFKEAIPYKAYDYNFIEKINIYNHLNCNKLKSGNKECFPYSNAKITVKCENNKAIAEFE